MSPLGAALFMFVLVGTFAGASTVEASLKPICGSFGLPPGTCTYQADGGVPGDASDSCLNPYPALTPGRTVRGLVVPVDDPDDNYAFAVSAPGQQVTIFLQVPVDVEITAIPQIQGPGISAGVQTPRPVLHVYLPGCAQLVTPSDGSTADRITFVAPTAGVYTVQVEDSSGQKLDGSASLVVLPRAAGLGLGPRTQTCNPICGQVVNQIIGYAVTAS